MQKARDEQGNEVLSPLDKLYVVHVKMGKSKDRERWDAGGPLLPSLQVALASYPYTIVELEVRPRAHSMGSCSFLDRTLQMTAVSLRVYLNLMVHHSKAWPLVLQVTVPLHQTASLCSDMSF